MINLLGYGGQSKMVGKLGGLALQRLAKSRGRGLSETSYPELELQLRGYRLATVGLESWPVPGARRVLGPAGQPDKGALADGAEALELGA